MIINQLIPAPGTQFDLESDLDRLTELYRPPSTSWLRLNFVASIDGIAADSNGLSEGLSSRTDRRILGLIRKNSDVVLVGAGSVRAEGYFLPRSTDLAVVTSTGDLGGHQFPKSISPEKLTVFCPKSAKVRLVESLGEVPYTVIELPGPEINLREVIKALNSQGRSSIVCEGGPTLAAKLIDAGLVQELCLTINPSLIGAGPGFLSGLVDGKTLELSQLLLDEESLLYGRWLLKP